MGVKIGLDCKLYVDDAVSYGSPTWTEVPEVADVTLNLEADEADVNTRLTSWKLAVPTLKGASIDFSMPWDTSQSHFTALLNAWLNRTVVDMAVMDGPIATAGSQGFRAVMMVAKFTRNEPVAGVVTADVTVKPTWYPSQLPQWMSI